MDNFNINDAVVLIEATTKKPHSKPITGSFIGTATHMHRGQMLVVAVVKLDEGFYDPSKRIYTDTILVHPGNMEKA